jgi:hypothetical protein
VNNLRTNTLTPIEHALVTALVSAIVRELGTESPTVEGRKRDALEQRQSRETTNATV